MHKTLIISKTGHGNAGHAILILKGVVCLANLKIGLQIAMLTEKAYIIYIRKKR